MDNNFQKVIFEELNEFLDPVVDTGGDSEAILAFFTEVGWDINALLAGNNSSIITIISETESALLSLTDLATSPPNSIIELKEAIQTIAPIINSLQKFSNSTGIPDLPNHPRIVELPEDIVHFLLATYLLKKLPFLFRFLELVAVLRRKEGEPIVISNLIGDNILVHNPINSYHFYFDSLGPFLSDPKLHFEKLYWPNGFADLTEITKVANGLFPKIAALLATLNINSFIGRGIAPFDPINELEKKLEGLMTLYYSFYDPDIDASGNITATMGLLSNNEGGPGIYVVPSGQLTVQIPLENWVVSLLANGQIDGFSVKNTGFDIYSGNGDLKNFTFELAISKITQPETKALLIGSTDSTRIEIGEITFGGSVNLDALSQEFKVYTDLKDCAIVIAAGEGDTFLKMVLGGNEIKASYSLRLIWSNISGFHFEGSGGIEIMLPLHLQLGPIDIQNMLIGIKPENGTIPIEVSTTIKAALGPLVVVVENLGLAPTLTFPENGQGNLGALDLSLGFKPPNGLGLSIDVGVVKGGGYLFFDFDKQEYAGALELSVSGFLTLTAIGIVTTKMPDGSPGFSLLLIITAEFQPAFQLSYGFTLIGVGGLLGLNRMVLLDPLRDGVRTGAIEGIMFPKNVVANAPRIISDLKAIFPPNQGSFLIGPMAKLGWGTPTLISLALGVIIQLPDPKIAIIGVLKMVLPDEEAPVLKAQVNFVGTIDPSNQLITFDASLFDSNLLQTMTLDGDMAVRLKWGDRPDFIMSVGGFHPNFQPTMPMPRLDRLSIKILDETDARIRMETYFAITSNTAQFGVKCDMYFNLEAITIDGNVQFDTLLQFSPFTFEATCSGNFTMQTFLGDADIRVRAMVNGPAAWYVDAHGSIEVFGLSWYADYQKTWGDEIKEILPEIDIAPEFIKVISSSGSWHTELPPEKQQFISIRSKLPELPSETEADQPETEKKEEMLRLHPFGTLVLSQRLLPLNLTLDKFGNQKVSGQNLFVINGIQIGESKAKLTDVKDMFARAQFQELSDTEKLASASFESFTNGVKAEFSEGSGNFMMGKVVRRTLEYEVWILAKEPVKCANLTTIESFSGLVGGSASKNSKLSKKYRDELIPQNGENRLKETPSTFTLLNINNNEAVGNSGVSYNSKAQAQEALSKMEDSNQALKGNIHIAELIEI